MKTIHKYPLHLSTDPQTLTVPMGAEFVHVAAQHDLPTVWAVVSIGRPDLTEDRVLHLVRTGGDVPSGTDHLGTVHVEEYVFHVFLTRRGGLAGAA